MVGNIRCPKCNSEQITAEKKGFGLGKAAGAGLLLGPIGLLGGFLGSSKVMITCLNCGAQWRPGTGAHLDQQEIYEIEKKQKYTASNNTNWECQKCHSTNEQYSSSCIKCGFSKVTIQVNVA